MKTLISALQSKLVTVKRFDRALFSSHSFSMISITTTYFAASITLSLLLTHCLVHDLILKFVIYQNIKEHIDFNQLY